MVVGRGLDQGRIVEAGPEEDPVRNPGLHPADVAAGCRRQPVGRGPNQARTS